MKELTLDITNNCSLNCIHCSTNALKAGSISFTHAQVLSYLDQFPDFESIRLSGGEPFNNPNLREILRAVKGRKKHVTVLTSGVSFDKSLRLDDFVQLIDELVFSIQGPRQVHNHVVGTNFDAYSIMLNSTFRAEDLGIPYSFHTVAMTQNYAEFPALARYIGSTKMNWHVLRLTSQGRADSSMLLTETQLADLPRLLDSFAKEYGIEVTMSDSFKREKCNCGTEKAAVTCQGTIVPCSALKYSQRDGFPCCRSVI